MVFKSSLPIIREKGIYCVMDREDIHMGFVKFQKELRLLLMESNILVPGQEWIAIKALSENIINYRKCFAFIKSISRAPVLFFLILESKYQLDEHCWQMSYLM